MSEYRNELARRADDTGTYTSHLSLRPDGSICASVFDFGPAVERLRGGDHERDLLVPSDQVAKLCFHLLATMLEGASDPVSEFKAICEKHGIAIEESGWN